MKIYVKQLYNEKGEKIPITLPAQAVKKDDKGNVVKTNAAGYDVVATSDPKIVGEKWGDDESRWKRIDYIEYETNLFIAPSAVTFHTLIHPRSSVSKYNLVLANSIGLVDNDYRGMVICRFKYIWQPEDFMKINGASPNMDKVYKKGDAIAQLVVEPTIQIEWELVDDLTKTVRGEGGFGHTDEHRTQVQVTEHKTSASPLLDMYKKISPEDFPSGQRPSYEKMVKERERQLPS